MEEDKERDLEILKNYQKKEAQGIKKIFIVIFILVALGYLANLLMQIQYMHYCLTTNPEPRFLKAYS